MSSCHIYCLCAVYHLTFPLHTPPGPPAAADIPHSRCPPRNADRKCLPQLRRCHEHRLVIMSPDKVRDPLMPLAHLTIVLLYSAQHIIGLAQTHLLLPCPYVKIFQKRLCLLVRQIIVPRQAHAGRAVYKDPKLCEQLAGRLASRLLGRRHLTDHIPVSAV